MNEFNKKIYFITAAFNEEEILPLFLTSLDGIIKSCPTNYSYYLYIINDGSLDDTENVILNYIPKNFTLEYKKFSRNFGKEAAITAGIESIHTESHLEEDFCAIILDCDLEDPLEIIPKMIQKWEEGFKNVLARRVRRDEDSPIKRNTAKYFYRIINKISDSDIHENVGDFRLIDKDVVFAVQKLKEKNRFMKGILSWPGFNKTFIDYSRPKRPKGETKWNYVKLWKLALDGIFSFSSVPLKVWSYIGIFLSIPSGLYLFYIFFNKIFIGVNVDGYSSIMASILFMGSVQLISLGVIGEYLSRVFDETKNRPLYIIEKSHKINRVEE